MLATKAKRLGNSSWCFSNEIRDWAGGCFCGCHNTCLSGYHEFKKLGSKYNCFPLKNSCGL